MRTLNQVRLSILVVCLAAVCASAQSFRVQCPTTTITHPQASNVEPGYIRPAVYKCSVDGGCAGYQGVVSNAGSNNTGYLIPTSANGAIKCQQIAGGDGYSTMGDGTQTYMFSFGPLSGLADIAKGLPGTQFPNVFNTVYLDTNATPLQAGDPATTDNAGGNFIFNGAIGLTGDQQVSQSGGTTATAVAVIAGGTVTAVNITNPGSGYIVPPTVTFSSPQDPAGIIPDGIAVIAGGQVVSITLNDAGSGYTSAPTVTLGSPLSGVCAGATGQNTPAPCLTGHVDPRQIMDVGVMNGNIPAPLMAIDEDDEFFLTLTNVGMIMRPDLFEQHTVHFHGYPNASTFYDGVPDASVAINIGGSFTYYYLAPDAGTYFWHCHITPPEHLQMGMVGQLYVRPRQNRVLAGTDLGVALKAQQQDQRTKCDSTDILCSNPMPAGADPSTGTTGVTQISGGMYAYNDGDASTRYDVEYPIQIHGFDPNFHFVGMTFNPEGFADMKDKYFLLNGRSYPDTVTAGPLQTQSADGASHFSQPLPAIINIPAGGRALLRISDLDVSEYQTLASLGIPMHVIALNAKMLRDQEGNNMAYDTNSITLGGGESLDVILDACAARASDGSCTTPMDSNKTYYLYTPNLDHLTNDAENFGGLMTEVHVCSHVTGGSTFGNTCVNN